MKEHLDVMAEIETTSGEQIMVPGDGWRPGQLPAEEQQEAENF